MATTYLTRTFGSAGNRQSWTWSGWIKKSKVYNSSDSGDREVFFGGYSANNDTDWLEFGTQGDILFATSSSTSTTSTQFLRDVNGWYHVLVNYNGSNLKFYINNELFKDSTDFSGNRGINVAGVHTIGALATNQSSRRFNGVMSHVHFVDGAVLAPTVFGETDSTTGEWKIIVEPTVSSYGTNGFFILKNGNSLTDQSPNSNNFTVGGGTLTKTEDCPSNVFDTYNPLTIIGSDPTLSNGNTKISSTTGNHWRTTNNNIGMSSGKYYWETKVGTISNSNYCRMGVVSENLISTQTTSVFSGNYAYGINWDGSKLVNSTQSSYTSIATGDIFMFALDLDNNFIYGGRNGTWVNSGDPTSGGSGTNALSAVQSGQTYFISGSVYQSSQETNFGNGYFGTTAVSSAGTNASGIGIFEYDVPTGYTALSTKGLNE